MSIPPSSPWRGCASDFPQPVEDELDDYYIAIESMSSPPTSPCRGSIPLTSRWRGCASDFPQPVEDELAAKNLWETVYYFNCRVADQPLHDIIYRSSDREQDITRHVFRWDLTSYEQVFANGFRARRQDGTPESTFFNLNHYVHHGGRPLDLTKPVTHAFVSTTLNSRWRPTPNFQHGQQIQVYRYEIYAPGGIWVRETLADLYQYPAQDEVAFISGIVPQYIRSAQLFIATREPDSRYPRWRRADQVLRINGNFNPQSNPPRLLTIQRPVCDYRAVNGTNQPLTIVTWTPKLPHCKRKKRDAMNDTLDWYTSGVADSGTYINAAFRSSRSGEAYLFMKNEYVLLNYAPGSTDDRIVNGPLLICDGYPSLIGTVFGEHGIDCAFDSLHGNQAFIFSGNLCAHIHYAPGTYDDKVLMGPMTITAMFPFFEGTVFASSIDAAFTSTRSYEAYLFKDNYYALIDYDSKTCIADGKITEGFHSLKNTIFESGVEAAFASHRVNEAYLFKEDQYACINFAPGTTDDYIIGGVKLIAPNWPSLGGILQQHQQQEQHRLFYQGKLQVKLKRNKRKRNTKKGLEGRVKGEHNIDC